MKFTAFYLVTGDDFCLEQSVNSLWAQGVDDFFFCIPYEYWNGTPVNKANVSKIMVVMDKLKGQGASVDYFRLHPREFNGGRYIQMETVTRNVCLARMRDNGKEHILIVDGDELWRSGSVKKLARFLEISRAKAATIHATLVVGFPGYPIGGAHEGLLVYVGDDTCFVNGRTTGTFPLHLGEVGVYHFTSTRRSYHETVEKHRKSSHFDDPQYNFERWIEKKLPKLKPGAKDCHMFVKWQIWPEVRDFTKSEWVELPEDLKPFLGKPK